MELPGVRLSTQYEWLAHSLQRLPATSPGQILLKDASKSDAEPTSVISTDPPYYDNIGYADLSDFFYVWLRRTLSAISPRSVSARSDTAKMKSSLPLLIVMVGRIKAESFFLSGMKKALGWHMRRRQVTRQQPSTTPSNSQKRMRMASRQLAGLAFLQAVVDSGLALMARGQCELSCSEHLKKSVNALASSIVLVCRRRDSNRDHVTRADFLRALRREMPAALAEIRRAGVGPTDIQQAAIGPGIGIFTRYAQVLNTDGTPMLVKDALKLINQVREEITSHRRRRLRQRDPLRARLVRRQGL